MSNLLISIIPGGWLTVIGGLLTLIAGAAWRVFAAGRAKERARQAEREAEARDIADQVQNDVGAMTPDQRKEALKKWAR